MTGKVRFFFLLLVCSCISIVVGEEFDQDANSIEDTADVQTATSVPTVTPKFEDIFVDSQPGDDYDYLQSLSMVPKSEEEGHKIFSKGDDFMGRFGQTFGSKKHYHRQSDSAFKKRYNSLKREIRKLKRKRSSRRRWKKHNKRRRWRNKLKKHHKHRKSKSRKRHHSQARERKRYRRSKKALRKHRHQKRKLRKRRRRRRPHNSRKYRRRPHNSRRYRRRYHSRRIHDSDLIEDEAAPLTNCEASCQEKMFTQVGSESAISQEQYMSSCLGVCAGHDDTKPTALVMSTQCIRKCFVSPAQLVSYEREIGNIVPDLPVQPAPPSQAKTVVPPVAAPPQTISTKKEDDTVQDYDGLDSDPNEVWDTYKDWGRFGSKKQVGRVLNEKEKYDKWTGYKAEEGKTYDEFATYKHDEINKYLAEKAKMERQYADIIAYLKEKKQKSKFGYKANILNGALDGEYVADSEGRSGGLVKFDKFGSASQVGRVLHEKEKYDKWTGYKAEEGKTYDEFATYKHDEINKYLAEKAKMERQYADIIAYLKEKKQKSKYKQGRDMLNMEVDRELIGGSDEDEEKTEKAFGEFLEKEGEKFKCITKCPPPPKPAASATPTCYQDCFHRRRLRKKKLLKCLIGCDIADNVK